MLARTIPSWQSQYVHRAPDQVASANISLLRLNLKEAFRRSASAIHCFSFYPRNGSTMIVCSSTRRHRLGCLPSESEAATKQAAAEHQGQRLALQAWPVSTSAKCMLKLGNRCRSKLIVRIGERFGFCLRNQFFGMVRPLGRRRGNGAGNTRVRRRRFCSPAKKSRPR